MSGLVTVSCGPITTVVILGRMDLRTFLDAMTPAERRAFAARCGTTPNYLAQLHYGIKLPGPAMARTLYEQSGRKVPLEKMRPDIWGSSHQVCR